MERQTDAVLLRSMTGVVLYAKGPSKKDRLAMYLPAWSVHRLRAMSGGLA